MRFGVMSKGVALTPLVFSSGKTQVDIIKECVDHFHRHNVVVLRGSVGSGKSIIGNIVSREMKGAVVVVPTKTLQHQYHTDYGQNNITIDGVKIGIVTGRANHQCKYTGRQCNDKHLPCTRKLKDKEKRSVVGKECPHFVNICGEVLSDYTESRSYNAISGRYGVINLPSDPCSYYHQFCSYADDTITILNAALFGFEVTIGRLPSRMVVVDEADEWLDSLALRSTFTPMRMSRIANEAVEPQVDVQALQKRYDALHTLTGFVTDISQGIFGQFWGELKDTLAQIDTDYTTHYLEKLSLIEEFNSATAFCEWPKIDFLVPEPGVVLNRYFERVNNKWLFMSATMQGVDTLGEIYGISDVGYVEGETQMKGCVVPKIYPMHTYPINYRLWNTPGFQTKYFNSLQLMIAAAKKPLYVAPHASQYIPKEYLGTGTEIDVQKFKDGELDVLVSHKIRRGVDFPNAEACLMCKYPWPQNDDPLLRAMRQKYGTEKYNRFYFDLAFRTYLQQLGRGLRHEGQILELWSPDYTVFSMLSRTKVTTQ